MEFLMPFLMTDFLGTPTWFWLVFIVMVIALLVFDLGVLHRDNHEIGVTESLKLSAFYIAAGLLFGTWVWFERGAEKGMEYMTGFVVEKTLAMDNIFVIAMIFSYFAIPRKYQHRVLFWGVLGVILLRGIMIGLGATLVAQFGWVLYIFALFLVLTGYKLLIMTEAAQKWFASGKTPRQIASGAWVLLCALMGYAAYLGMDHTGETIWVQGFVYLLTLGTAALGVKVTYMTHEENTDLADNPLLLWLKKHLRVTNELHGQNFTVKQPDPKTGKLVTFFTPLFLALVMIEIADVIFAVDSVPAIFAITTDPFIVYTSNIFAILGLRALYFALAAMMARFTYLKYALSMVLIFIGSKIFISNLMGWEKFPAAWSLAITVAILAVGVIYSLWKTRGQKI
jgi:tellurite resistance protein TerC